MFIISIGKHVSLTVSLQWGLSLHLLQKTILFRTKNQHGIKTNLVGNKVILAPVASKCSRSGSSCLAKLAASYARFCAEDCSMRATPTTTKNPYDTQDCRQIRATSSTTYKIVGPKTTKANDLGPAFRYGGLKACCPKDLAVKI